MFNVNYDFKIFIILGRIIFSIHFYCILMLPNDFAKPIVLIWFPYLDYFDNPIVNPY